MDGFKNLISIEERKSSALIICLLALILYTLLMSFLQRPTGTVDPGFASIIQSIVWGVVGVNGVNALDNYVSYRSRVKQLDEQPQEESLQ